MSNRKRAIITAVFVAMLAFGLAAGAIANSPGSRPDTPPPADPLAGKELNITPNERSFDHLPPAAAERSRAHAREEGSPALRSDPEEMGARP